MSKNYDEIITNFTAKSDHVFLSVKKTLIIDKTKGANKMLVNDDELLAIVSLTYAAIFREDIIHASVENLYCWITGKSYNAADKSLLNSLVAGVKSLNNKGIISILNTDNIKPKTVLTIDITNILRKGKEEFIALDLREVRRILTINDDDRYKVDRNKLLMLFMIIVEPISRHDVSKLLFAEARDGKMIPQFEGENDFKKFEGMYSFRSVENMSLLCHKLSNKTVHGYLNILENVKLVYVKSHDKYITGKDNRPHKIFNWYCRYQFRRYIDGIASIKYNQIDYATEVIPA